MRFTWGLLALLAAGPVQASKPRVEVQGHRGARAVRPENTLPAFQYALEAGVDTLELDLAVTADDHLVVSHDPHISPERCSAPKRAIREMPLAEIRKLDCGSKRHPRFASQKVVPGARMPTLAEVFELVARSKLPVAKRVQFNVETKSFPAHPHLTPTPDRFAQLVVEAIKKHGLIDRVVVQSFDHRTLQAVKSRLPKVRIALLNDGTLVDFVALARAAGAEIVSPNREWITAADVRALHAIGVRVIPWTVNSTDEADRLLALGVDGLITDDPARIIRHLERIGRR